MAKTLMPSSISAAATSSWVESGFEAQSVMSAPPACSVVIRKAVSLVTCRQAETRIPLSGFCLRNLSAMLARTGIDRAAHSMRPWPFWASFMSFTSCGRFILATAIAELLSGKASLLQTIEQLVVDAALVRGGSVVASRLEPRARRRLRLLHGATQELVVDRNLGAALDARLERHRRRGTDDGGEVRSGKSL